MALLRQISPAKGSASPLRLVEGGERPEDAVPADGIPSGSVASPALALTTIIHPNPSDERVALLGKLLKRLGYEVATSPSVAAFRKTLRDKSPRRVAIVADEKSDAAVCEDAVSLAEGGGAAVVYVAETMSVEQYKRLVRSGAGEWVKWLALPREIGDVLRSLEVATRPAPQQEAAMIVSFLPSKGGVGNTTLAIETATQLVSRNKALRGQIAVVDLNFEGGTLGDYLDIESRFDIGEILIRPDRLDSHLVDIFCSKHGAQFDVFSCPPRFGEKLDIPADVIFSFLDHVGAKYDLVILDLPATWQVWTDNVLLGSSAVVVTGESTVPGVRQLSSKLRHLGSLEIPHEKSAVAVNRCKMSLLGGFSRKADVGRALEGHEIIYVAADDGLAAEAANTGRPMAHLSPRRGVSRTIRKLAEWIETVRKS